MARTATPDKSFIAVTMTLAQTGSSVRKTIKFINKKGTFIYSPTCDTCIHQGKVQDNLGYGILNNSCDRDMATKGTWRKQGNFGYTIPKHCKFFREKEEKDATNNLPMTNM